MAPENVPKTAITTLFEFARMPFGLRNSAQTFQKFVDQVLQGLTFAYAYIDDILIASSSQEEHTEAVFQRLSDYGLIININKCVFCSNSLHFLGHYVDANGIHPIVTKVQAITEFPKLQSTKQLRQFLGLVNFYHRFIPNCAHIVHPLHTLLKANVLIWNEEASKDFEDIKVCLAKATMLSHPKLGAPASIMSDASNTAVGKVLQQFVDGVCYPISYFSCKLSSAETKYSTFDSELLAIYLAIKHFRHFIEGREFHAWTDLKPLTFSFPTNSNRYSPHQACQLDFISQFTTDIRHVKGSNNPVGDALSRDDIN